MKPDILCDSLQGVYGIAAQIQYHGGARVKEITHLAGKHLLGGNKILLTNTKGGRRRTMELPPELYEQVAGIIRQDGVFRFQYRTYLRHLQAAALETAQPYTGSTDYDGILPRGLFRKFRGRVWDMMRRCRS